MGRFSEVFNPETPEDQNDKMMKLFLSILSIGFAQIGTKVLRAGIQAIIKDQDKVTKATKTMKNLVKGNLRKARERAPASQTAIQAQNEISMMVSELISQWRTNIAEAAEAIINPNWDDHEAIMELGEDIGEGRWLTFESGNLFDMQKILDNTMYGQMLPAAWGMKENIHPVIIMEHVGCDDGRPDAPKQKDDFQEDDNTWRYVNPDDANRAKVCHDGKTFYVLQHNHKGYQISAYNTGYGRFFGQTSKQSGSQSHTLTNLAGGNGDELNGSNWGGVTLADLVISAYEGYKYNGNMNGYQMPEDSTLQNAGGGNHDLPFDEGIKTPGMVKIPICTAREAYVTIKDRLGSSDRAFGEHYPCPS